MDLYTCILKLTMQVKIITIETLYIYVFFFKLRCFMLCYGCCKNIKDKCTSIIKNMKIIHKSWKENISLSIASKNMIKTFNNFLII